MRQTLDTYLVSFADIRFRCSQKRLQQSALAHGIGRVVSYSPKNFRGTSFFKENRKILEQERGAGYWLWKPYIILETLYKVPEDAVVVYADAGIEITADLSPLFSLCQSGSGIMIFHNCENVCSHWTKRDCFVLMGCDAPQYWSAPQVLGSFMLVRKTRSTTDFVQEWFRYCSDASILTDVPNTCAEDNLLGYVEHRHDQSVLSLLAARQGLELHRDPTQWGNYAKAEDFRVPGEFLHRDYTSEPFKNSPYGTLLNHHRQHSTGLLVRAAYFLKSARKRMADVHMFREGM